LPQIPAWLVGHDVASLPSDPLLRLRLLGWRDAALPDLPPGAVLARVARVDRGRCTLFAPDAVARASTAEPPAGTGTADPEGPITVGDWVVARLDDDRRAEILRILPRRTAFVRGAPGGVTAEQTLAANVDVAFVVTPLDVAPRLRRLERFLALAWESGATPVVVATKADRSDDVAGARAEIERVAIGVDVEAVSALTGSGLDALRARVAGSRTVVLLGPSGAGKSTLANALLGRPALAVQEVRRDGKGRHTTTHRELVVLPGGGVLIDTPGLRGLLLWEAADGVERAFADIEELAAGCRFSDCRHAVEPGCAVVAAVESGALDPTRLEAYRKLERELASLERRQDARARIEERRRAKTIERSLRRDGVVRR
jgi:ribosome biogenesis GTPase